MLTLHIVTGVLLMLVAATRFVVVLRGRTKVRSLQKAAWGLMALQVVSGVMLAFAYPAGLARICASALVTIALLGAVEYLLYWISRRRLMRQRAGDTLIA